MDKVLKSENRIFFQVDSLPQKIEKIIDETKLFLANHNVHECHEFTIVQRELLKNAVEHGNHSNPDLKIMCTIEMHENNKVTLSVEDSGDGFQYSSLDMSIPNNPNGIIQRGYILINAFSEKIEFNENGNRVTAHITLTIMEGQMNNNPHEKKEITP